MHFTVLWERIQEEFLPSENLLEGVDKLFLDEDSSADNTVNNKFNNHRAIISNCFFDSIPESTHTVTIAYSGTFCNGLIIIVSSR